MKTGWIKRNKLFLESLDKPGRITLFFLLGIQFTFYLYYLLVTPLHYDEWHSWHIFSGNSFWVTLSYYPAPNNHVFYNLISRFFVLTGIPSEIAVRLPSLFASLFASYYFFKVCKSVFSTLLSLALLMYLITLYPFVDYSFMGRGYSFLNLFCILMIYASSKLSADYRGLKYRALFILSPFLGLFTVPSFLYALLPIYVLLGIYVVRQKSIARFFLFVTDGLISGMLVIAAYSFILYNNDPQNLLNPNNGSNSFSMNDPDALDKISFYLNTLFYELFDSGKLPFVSALVLIAVISYHFREKNKSHYLLNLSALMFFSPFLIMVIHQVFPFGRNWLYLAFPVALCFGFILQSVRRSVGFIKTSEAFRKYVFVLYALILIVATLQLSKFGAKHRSLTAWDYEIDFFRRKKLAPVARRVLNIGKTRSGMEFYPAEVIALFCEKNNPGEEIKLTNMDESADQDLLIINGEELETYRKRLVHYDFAYEHNNIWMYFKKK